MAILNKKNLILFFLFLGFLGVSFGAGFYFGEISVEPRIIFGLSNAELGQPPEVDFSLFWNAWYVLQNKYVDKENLDYQKMIYGAISGMVESLEDPYTVFLKPDESKRFKEDVSGFFEGVGMEIDIRKGQLMVVSPIKDSPAYRAGLKAGDKILKINETSTNDITIEEAVSLIRGPRKTEVVLTVIREGWDEQREFRIVRDVIEIPSLEWELKQDKKGNNVALIKLHLFTEKADSDFRKTAIEILDSPAEKIILDLRNNPGGYLEVAQEIAGWFLEREQIVTIEDFGAGKEQKFYKAAGNSKLLPYPTVILVNKGSASGSEILAGALKDNRGIKLIGEKTFGKGSVQELEDLKSGASLKVTIAKWLTPNGNFITDVGLEPDVKIEMTEENYEAEQDPQLEKAIEIISEME